MQMDMKPGIAMMTNNSIEIRVTSFHVHKLEQKPHFVIYIEASMWTLNVFPCRVNYTHQDDL